MQTLQRPYDNNVWKHEVDETSTYIVNFFSFVYLPLVQK